MENKSEFLSTTELAGLLGISRIAVFKKIKKGEIRAKKIGRNFVIDAKGIGRILGNILTARQKKELDSAVDKAAKEYGETLKLLGRE